MFMGASNISYFFIKKIILFFNYIVYSHIIKCAYYIYIYIYICKVVKIRILHRIAGGR